MNPMQPHSAPATNAIDGRTFAIGVLSVTACVLFVGLLMLANRPPAALGIGQNDRAGDYIMLTQQVSNSNEAVIIIDAAAKRMCVYAVNVSNKRIELLQAGIPLDKLPGTRGNEPRDGRAP